MDITKKSKDQVTLQGKFSKLSKSYLGFYLPKKLEMEFGKNADVTIIIRKKTRRVSR